jgi:3-hydroxyacyl-[acyl-carrier-protein] dehydratase
MKDKDLGLNTPIEAVDILKLLPHRYPFFLVDRVMSYEAMNNLTAIKNVTINEPFFAGHYPGNPIMPGVLIVEAMAQSCGILSYLSLEPEEGHKMYPLFAGIDNVRFKQVVIPGDQLRFEVKMANRKRDIWKMEANAYIEDKIVCSATLISAIKEVPL